MPQTRSDNTRVDYDDPAESAAAVTPNNSTDLTNTARSLFIGTGGDVKVDLAGTGTAVVFKNVPSGGYIYARVTRVYATDTDATDIVALW